MIVFKATAKKFASKGEKTGWTCFEIPEEIAQQINPGIKKSYRVKGYINNCVVNSISLLPNGSGGFYLALNKDLRKQLCVTAGSEVELKLMLDNTGYQLNKDFVECLKDEPIAFDFFNTLPQGHRNYFSKWIEQAKTVETQTKRIAQSVDALSRNWGYSEMIRNSKNI